MILMKGSVRLCQEHEDIARALAEKDVQLAEARRERDECRVVIRDHIPVFQAKIAALEADLAAMRGHVRTIQDQHRCGQEHVEHEYPCEICNAIDAALASSPGAAQVCTFCLGPLSKNPHTLAGKPDSLLTIGSVFVCIPCVVKSRHEWAERTYRAEAGLETAREVVEALDQEHIARKAEWNARGGGHDESVCRVCALLARPEVKTWRGR